MSRNLQSQEDFEIFVERNLVFKIQIGNGKFTWTNRRTSFYSIVKKLDRFLFKGDLSLFPFTLESKIFPGVGFDHFLINSSGNYWGAGSS